MEASEFGETGVFMAHSCGALVGAKIAFAAAEVQAAPMALGL
jgi:hypothetical protein